MLSYWLGLIPAARYLGVINGSFRGGPVSQTRGDQYNYGEINTEPLSDDGKTTILQMRTRGLCNIMDRSGLQVM